MPLLEPGPNGAPVAADLAFRDGIGLGIDVGFDSAPRFVDIDGDGDLDVLTGTQDGPIRFFRNTGSATNPNYVEEQGIAAFRPSTVPAFGDLDGDGDLDSVVGNRSGGLLFYSNGVFQVSVAAPPEEPGGRTMNLSVEPNPSTGRVIFRVDGDVPDDAELLLIGLVQDQHFAPAVPVFLGRVVVQVDVSGVSRGAAHDEYDQGNRGQSY